MPIIGVTAFFDHRKDELPRIKLNEAYVQAVIRAGGIPLLIPVGLQENTLPELFQKLDGIVFTGGGDIDPEIYNGTPFNNLDGVDKRRDALEIALVKAVIEKKMPFLGICRGFEIVNVALGGTLYTDLGEQFPNALPHSTPSNIPRSHLAHKVNVEKGSPLAAILGSETTGVNSLHHQGIKQLSSSLVPTAYATDGLVEGWVLPNHPFGLGIQWHPEELQELAPMRGLFQALIKAAS